MKESYVNILLRQLKFVCMCALCSWNCWHTNIHRCYAKILKSYWLTDWLTEHLHSLLFRFVYSMIHFMQENLFTFIYMYYALVYVCAYVCVFVYLREKPWKLKVKVSYFQQNFVEIKMKNFFIIQTMST